MRTLAAFLLMTVPAVAAEDPHAHHQMPPAQAPDPHAGHQMPSAPASDFAADAIYGANVMAAARHQLQHEHGDHTFSKVMVDELEYTAGREGGYRWNAEAWVGGDINRAVFKTEGEGGRNLHEAEVQALYSRAIGPYFDVQAGVRYDIKPDPSRAYAVLGLEGLAPYWFEMDAAAFLSDRGDLLARFGASYDQLITQRLVLQPHAELNFAAQDMRAQGIGGGLSNMELGLRLRYEVRREFAPYVGVSYTRKTGKTADFARAAGDEVDDAAFVVGVRAWF